MRHRTRWTIRRSAQPVRSGTTLSGGSPGHGRMRVVLRSYLRRASGRMAADIAVRPHSRAQFAGRGIWPPRRFRQNHESALSSGRLAVASSTAGFGSSPPLPTKNAACVGFSLIFSALPRNFSCFLPARPGFGKACRRRKKPLLTQSPCCVACSCGTGRGGWERSAGATAA